MGHEAGAFCSGVGRGSIKDICYDCLLRFPPPFGEESIQICLGDSLPVHAVWEEVTLFLILELGPLEHCLPRPHWLAQGWERDPTQTETLRPDAQLWLAPPGLSSSLSAEVARRAGGGLGLLVAILLHHGMRSTGEGKTGVEKVRGIPKDISSTWDPMFLSQPALDFLVM